MIDDAVELGTGVQIPQPDLVNLYGCIIGDYTKIGAFVEIQKGSHIGSNCKISSHSFICEGVRLGDGVFIGHGVVFINDLYPRALNESGNLKTDLDWLVVPTTVQNGVAIGSNATILAGLTIEEHSTIGAGAVVTSDVKAGTTVAGNPAQLLVTSSRPFTKC